MNSLSKKCPVYRMILYIKSAVNKHTKQFNTECNICIIMSHV